MSEFNIVNESMNFDGRYRTAGAAKKQQQYNCDNKMFR